jgi:hypothetical protein
VRAVHKLSGDLWELLREEGLSSGPERHSRRISTGKTAVPVKFDLVEPFLTMGKFLNRQCIHRLDKANLGQRESSECFCFHKEAASVDTFSVLLDHFVGTVKHRLWNGEADLFGGFEIYY